MSTMQDAFETAECIADDLKSGGCACTPMCIAQCSAVHERCLSLCIGALGVSQPISYQEMLSHLQGAVC